MEDTTGLTIGMVIGLLVGIAFIVGSYNLADQKGYNPTVAALLTFLFGFWAFLVYLFLPNRSLGGDRGYASEPPSRLPEAQRNCWSCSAPVAGNPAMCQHCGSRLNF